MSKFISASYLQEFEVNPEGGTIYVDKKVKKWLDSFTEDGIKQKSKIEKEIYYRITKTGFEENLDISPPEYFPKISLILVLYNSIFWVDNLVKMFENLFPWLHEIIVIDNGSTDNCKTELYERISGLKCIINQVSKSFAAAINQGTKIATGEVFLIINPDVYIPKSSLWAMINCYQNDKFIAAISPKLLLMRTPGFINGIGNVVKPFWHGYDLGLGHLDVGQFDHIEELPSACFAAILIPQKSWKMVGRLDEEYPMYYEDSDWCYRARAIGLRIRFCQNSKIYHGYKSYKNIKLILNNNYLKNISYGRIRFVYKNFLNIQKLNYLLSYLLNDLFQFIRYFFVTRKNLLSDYLWVWKKPFKELTKDLKYNNQMIAELEIEKTKYSYPSVINGLPVLRWNSIKKITNNKKFRVNK